MTQDSDLLAPACAAVLTDWCGPLVNSDGQTVPYESITYGVWDTYGQGGRHPQDWADLSDVEPHLLDFSRSEVRDRVARVVGRPWRDEPGPGALSLRRSGDYVTLCIGGYVVADSRGVPALADLDPSDDTRLSDGSRRVDALALRAVYVEVCLGR